MDNWEVYVRESYDLIKEAEEALTVTLPIEIEAYVVHLFAHFIDKPSINTEPLGVKMMTSITLPIRQRKMVLKEVGDECLLINAMEWNKRRWPSDSYYAELGQSAYYTRACVEYPIEDVFDSLSAEFHNATKVLRKCKIN